MSIQTHTHTFLHLSIGSLVNENVSLSGLPLQEDPRIQPLPEWLARPVTQLCRGGKGLSELLLQYTHTSLLHTDNKQHLLPDGNLQLFKTTAHCCVLFSSGFLWVTGPPCGTASFLSALCSSSTFSIASSLAAYVAAVCRGAVVGQRAG